MQPQQTDVLDVDGPAIAPSIIEGAGAPASPVIYEDELFNDAPVATGPVTIVEPPTDTETSAPTAETFNTAETAPVTAATPTAEPAPAADATAPDTANADPLDEDAPTPVADDADRGTDPDAPSPEVEAPVADLAGDDLPLDGPVGRVQPPEPELEFTLEQLEDAAAGGAGQADVVPAATAAPETALVSAPVTLPERDPAAVAADEAEAATAAVEPTAAPTKTATYADIQNSEQEFVGAMKAKKFPLIDPDQFWVMVAAVVALGTILAANLTASFTSVYAMAEYTGLPKSVQAVPVVALDFAIVGFSWALMVFGARGDKVWSTRLYLFVVTGFSVVANFMHTYTHWKGDLSSPEAVFGVVFSSAVPLFSLVATEELIRLVFIRRNRRKTTKAVA
jgi:hypothetical protein